MSSNSEEPCPWRGVSPWELDDLYRQLRVSVLDLEEAHAQDVLADALTRPALIERVGPEIVDAYRALAGSTPRRSGPMRLDAVRSILALAREELFDLVAYADARLADPHVDLSQCSARSARLRFVARMSGGQDEVSMRLDQVLAARFWGIALAFQDVEAADAVAHLVAHACVRNLARGLRSLERVLVRFQPHGAHAEIHIVPAPSARRFERLMLDILNEECSCARVAPIEEDFLEKTDLRVAYPDLPRQRGARIQVTQLADAAWHEEKTSKIWRRSELVVLSPRTLAEHILSEDPSGLPAPLDDAFRAGLSKRTSSVDELAATIKRTLLTALRGPWPSPVGPLALVPRPLREIIRGFVRHAAFESTTNLREREHSIKGHGPSQPRATRMEPSAVHVGAIVEGTVTNIVKYGAFVDLGGSTGLLHVSVLGAAHVLAIGQRIRVHVAAIDGRRITLTLPAE